MKPKLIPIFLIIPLISFSQDLRKLEQYYSKGKFERAVEESKSILKKYPDELIAKHLLGRSLTNLSKYEEAIPILEELVGGENVPSWMKSWTNGYLGICYFRMDMYEKSKISLLAGIEGSTENSKNFIIKRLQRFQMTDYFNDWEIIETENIRFHIQSDHKVEDIDAFCRSRENAYNQNNMFFEATPYKKIDFYVWSKPEESINEVGRRLGFANSELCIVNSRIDQTRGHEITHILVDYGLSPVKKNRLINEGVAVAFDLTNRDKMALAKQSNKENYRVEYLMNSSEDIPESILYPIGGALIEFLMKRGEEVQLKALLENQTWDNLTNIYSEEIILEFDEMIMN